MGLMGQRFGRLLVESAAEPYISPKKQTKHRRWNCLCDCGNSKIIRESSLTSGYSNSCGCLAAEVAGKASITHGFSNNQLYSVWYGMHKRCYNAKAKDYKHYGGRGIKVCDRWLQKHDGVEEGFVNFLTDMESTFQKGLEIDRIDVNKNYEPSNCRWAPRRTQVINRRYMGNGFDARLIEYNGKTLCISEWADEVGVFKKVLSDRLGKLGWDIEKALTTPARPKKIFLVYKDKEIDLRDVFKFPPNHHTRATKLGVPFYQYCANLFKKGFKVKFSINKEWYWVESNEVDLGNFNLNLTKDFLGFCEKERIEI